MSVRARKVARDLLGNKARTVLVVVAIAIGLVGLSTTLRARAIFTTNLDAELAAANPASATILLPGAGPAEVTPGAGPAEVTPGAGPAEVTAVAAHPDVATAEGLLTAFGRIEVGDELRPLRLVVVDDLAGRALDRLRPEEGAWPPPTGSLVLERSSLDASGLAVGDIAAIEDPTGARHELPLAATTYDVTVVSGRLVDQVIFGYLSFATWEQLGLPVTFNEIAIEVAGDESRIAAVAADAADAVDGLGIRVPEPGKHVLDSTIASLLQILGSLGLLSLLLAGFLVFNTVAATMARQVDQIGVMKAIGASRRELLAMYLGTIAAYGGLALLVAIPVGALGARVLTSELGTLLNIDITRFGAPAWVWLVELGAGLAMPLAAALLPILAATRATVAEAIRGTGAATTFGASRVDRALARLRGLPGSISYAARNVFRRKLRLALTVVALSLAGAILVSVVTLRSSLLATVDGITAYWQQDVSVDLQQPLPFDQLEPLLPAAAEAEGWLVLPAAVVRPGGEEAGEETVVFGVPPDSRFIDPTLLAGRWLEPGDTDAAVINVDVAANEPALGVGDPLALRIQGTDVALRVVGEATTQLVGPGEPRPEIPIAYVPYSTLTAALGLPGGANRLAVAGDAVAVEAALRDAGVAIRSVETRERLEGQVERLTSPILVLLTAMAVVFALVGGIGLLGTMTLNALERTAEFGVVRAVGATGRNVLAIVLVEGVAVALLSFVVGALSAVPLSWVMSRAVGISFIKVPLAFRFALTGVLLWLALALVLAVVASWVPARTASRISVKDAITYE